jgi:hypothetical protein
VEFTHKELAALKEAELTNEENAVRELDALQLALVGGGSGDVAWA